MSIGTLIAAAGLVFPANDWYVHWHDSRYALKGEVVTVAASQTVQQIADRAQRTADANSQKLDMVNIQLAGIRVQGAVTVANAMQQELDRHLLSPQDTAAWREKRSQLKRQADRAIAYRDCLLEERINCEALRGF